MSGLRERHASVARRVFYRPSWVHPDDDAGEEMSRFQSSKELLTFVRNHGGYVPWLEVK
jgi:hypothetical protein